MRQRWLPGLLVVAVVAAAGAAVLSADDDTDPELSTGTGGSPATAVPNEMAWGGFRFPAEALLKAPEPADESHPAVDVMRSLLRDAAGRASLQATEVDTSQVRVLSSFDEQALLGVGDPTAPGFVHDPPVFVAVRMELAGDSWSPTDWSGCGLRTGTDAPPGESPVVWYPTGEVTPDSTSIRIEVLDQGCASGRTAEGRVRDPVIEYREHAVLATVTVESPSGSQTCQGSPPTPYVLELAEPLGDRLLLDGGRFPPAPPPDPNPPAPPISNLPTDALRPNPDGNVTLLVVNESESVDPIELHHMITGAVLPQASYQRGQGWVEYHFDLPTGLHQISVAAVGPGGVGQDGLEEFFEVTGPTWLVLRYSGDGGEGSLSFSAHDEPPPDAGT